MQLFTAQLRHVPGGGSIRRGGAQREAESEKRSDDAADAEMGWIAETRVSLVDARQAGAEGIVTALHDVPIGEVWPLEAIRERQELVRAAGMEWAVVESLDVSERIKLREAGF